MDDLSRAINRSRRSGLNDSEIRQHLLDEGWDARSINKALSKHTQSNVEPWPGGYEALARAAKQISKDPLRGFIYILLVSLSSLVIVVFIKHYPLKLKQQTVISAVDGLETLILYPYLIKYQLSLASGSKIPFSKLIKSDLMTYIRIIGTLAVMLILFVIGALLILIPLIWIIPWAYLILFPVIDDKKSPLDSLDIVTKLTANDKSKIWAIIGISFPLFIISVLLSAVPVLYTFLAYTITLVVDTTMASLYLWLKKNG